MKNKFILITLLFFFKTALSQNQKADYPEIGKPCPDFFLNDVLHYHKSEVSLADFQNQWLVLDFWNRYCGVCLGKFQAIDSLQKQFVKQINFMLVGYTGSQYTHRSDNKPIRELYEKLRFRLNLDLPIAFDSVLFHHFNIGACPYIVIIDPAGIIRGITTSLDEQDIKDILSNKSSFLRNTHKRREL
jgi:thiol-disulfide isomerase/thioredoxin